MEANESFLFSLSLLRAAKSLHRIFTDFVHERYLVLILSASVAGPGPFCEYGNRVNEGKVGNPSDLLLGFKAGDFSPRQAVNQQTEGCINHS